MRKWVITALVVAALVALIVSIQLWRPPFLSFLDTNSTLIQTLSDLVQLVLVVGTAAALYVGLWRRQKPELPPSEKADAPAIAAADDGTEATESGERPRVARVIGDGGGKVSHERDTALHQLPSPPRDFTGRVAELDELVRNVGRGGVNISGLHGMGGVGKTTLALKLAEHLTPLYPDAQFYLDLKGASAQPVSTADAMLHVIRAYDPTAGPPKDEAELHARYRSVLHGRRALLLMDNASGREQVEPLIPPETCVLLVTSRQHFILPGLFDKDLDTLPPEDARKLLLTIAPRIAEHADEIARLCGHLPLALRLAASALAERRDLSPADYLRRLSSAPQRLKLIDASLALSYDLLNPDLQKLWRTLAVFPDTFDARAAAAVWESEPDTAQDALSELVRLSMLEWDDTSTRYNLHDLARLCADVLMSKAERSTSQKHHAEHYLRVLGEAKNLYKQGGDVLMRGLALFDLERVNIEAGQLWAENHANEDGTASRLCSRYPNAGVYVLYLRHHPRERIHWLEAALTAARRLKDREAEGAHLINLGVAYRNLGEPNRAVKLFEQALVIEREIGYRDGEGNALSGLGLAYHNLGEMGRAVEFHEQHLSIARETGDKRDEGNALGNLGLAYYDLGETGRAIEFYEKQLAITREIGDRRGENTALWNMSLAFYKLGDRAQAIAYAEASLKIHEEMEDPFVETVRAQLAEWRGEA